MPHPIRAFALRTAAAGAVLAISACSTFDGRASTEDAQASAARGIDTLTRTADSISTEVRKRIGAGADTKDGPIVVMRGITSGERALGEIVGTRLIAAGVKVEAACTARCFEVSLIELAGLDLTDEQKRSLSAGDMLQVASSATPFLGGLTRVASERSKPARVVAMFVTVSQRDGNRYVERQQFIARIGGADPAPADAPPAPAAK